MIENLANFFLTETSFSKYFEIYVKLIFWRMSLINFCHNVLHMQLTLLIDINFQGTKRKWKVEQVFWNIEWFKELQLNQIKPLSLFAVLRVCRAHLCVIALAG